MATYKVLQPFQNGGISYNPGDYAEMDDNTAMVHAEHGNIELDSAREVETVTVSDVGDLTEALGDVRGTV